MGKKDEAVPVEIFSGSPVDVEIVKSLLENAEIEAFLKDEYVGTIAPYMSAGGMSPITIVVSSDDYDKAKQVVDDFLKTKDQDE